MQDASQNQSTSWSYFSKKYYLYYYAVLDFQSFICRKVKKKVMQNQNPRKGYLRKEHKTKTRGICCYTNTKQEIFDFMAIAGTKISQLF